MKVIVVAGGTGGHIYPAIAIIRKIQEMEKDSEILYIMLDEKFVHTLGSVENAYAESVQNQKIDTAIETRVKQNIIQK